MDSQHGERVSHPDADHWRLLDWDADLLDKVGTVEAGGKRALLPGDYAYKRMKSERGTPISLLGGGRFDAVVVPHHGDEVSSEQVSLPASKGSKAFFSAGTHQGYGHPTQSSLDAHQAAGFDIVEDHALRDIIPVQLIP